MNYATKSRISEVSVVQVAGVYRCLHCCVAGAGDVVTDSPGAMLRHLERHELVPQKTKQALRRLLNLQFDTPQYVSYDLSEGLPKDLPRRGYFVLDVSNGNPELGRGYIWVANTKQAVVELKAKHDAAPRIRSTLEGPWPLYSLATVFEGRSRPKRGGTP